MTLAAGGGVVTGYNEASVMPMAMASVEYGYGFAVVTPGCVTLGIKIPLN